MHIAKWKKPSWKDYILYDELYDISAKINLERQILVTVRGKARQGGEMNRWTTKAFYGSGNAIWYHKDGHISLCAVLSHSVMSDCLRPMDCNLPGSSVHGILQAKILGWFDMPSPRGSSQPRDWNQVSLTVGGFFTIWDTREAQEYCTG